MLVAVAGGGTFLTFPALVYKGVPPVAANPTSAVAVFPGYLGERSASARRSLPMTGLVRRIDIANDTNTLKISRRAVVAWLTDLAPVDTMATSSATSSTGDDASASSTTCDDVKDGESDLHRIELPLVVRQCGVERRLVIEGQNPSRVRLDHTLIDQVTRADIYLDALVAGRDLAEIAAHHRVYPEDVSRLLPVAFLSPRIVDAILTGQQPAHLTARCLTREIDLPIIWTTQDQLLGA